MTRSALLAIVTCDARGSETRINLSPTLRDNDNRTIEAVLTGEHWKVCLRGHDICNRCSAGLTLCPICGHRKGD